VPPEARVKTKSVLRRLDEGIHFVKLGGKKLWEDRGKQSVVIPVGRKHRMICRLEDGKVTPVKVITHEAYNRKSSRKA
jgi:hypothetical protein